MCAGCGCSMGRQGWRRSLHGEFSGSGWSNTAVTAQLLRQTGHSAAHLHVGRMLLQLYTMHHPQPDIYASPCWAAILCCFCCCLCCCCCARLTAAPPAASHSTAAALARHRMSSTTQHCASTSARHARCAGQCGGVQPAASLAGFSVWRLNRLAIIARNTVQRSLACCESTLHATRFGPLGPSSG